MKLLNADGSLNSLLEHAAVVDVAVETHVSSVVCYVTHIPRYPLILGDPWLKEHDARTSHKDRTLSLAHEDCLRTGCLRAGKPVLIYAQDAPQPEKDTSTQDLEVKFVSAMHFYRLARKSNHSAGILFPTGSSAQLCSATTNTVTPDDFDKFRKGKPKLSHEDLKARVPEYLHDLLDLFDQTMADALPEHTDEDHAIALEYGKDPPFARKYRPMSPQELEAVRYYLEDLIAKGHIRRSTSPAAAPILIVRKPGGGIRVCIDYRGLNEITIKNRHPIPHVNETLQRLQGCRYFTKFDVIAAFNRIRIAAGDEWKTAFTTRYGQFEYLVMPFGLCNAPGTFQSYINNSLKDYLDLWTTAYLDDVLIFSKTLEEHKEHVRKVATRLLERKLYVDIHKCEFEMREVKYLGLMVGSDGVRMDPEKVDAVASWEAPKSVKDVQAFLGFANFYRRFVKDYSTISKPLNLLTHGELRTTASGKKKRAYAPFEWTAECQNAFETLKIAFTTAPTLVHFDPDRETWIETDASDFVTAGVLSQMVDGVLRPVAFFSKKMTPTECNYEIYDKELLAIIKAFENWRPEAISVEPQNPIKIYSDHRSLEWFMTTKQLNRRQARWAEFLSEFNFRIMYRPGKQGEKPDALTRRRQDLPGGPEDERLRFQLQTVLKHDNLDPDLRAAISCAWLSPLSTPTPACAWACPLSTEPPNENHGVPDTPHLDDLMAEAYAEDEDIKTLMTSVNKREPKVPAALYKKGYHCHMGHLKIIGERLYMKNQLFVPLSHPLRLRLMQLHHNPARLGHPGYKTMFELLSRSYYWPNMRRDLQKFTNACTTCIRVRGLDQQKHGLLQPLEPPDRRWQSVSFDFIEKLPNSSWKNVNHRYILVMVDRLTKMVIAEGLPDNSVDSLLEAVHRRLFCTRGLIDDFINDRGSAMVAQLWKRICERYGISIKYSSAHHPETDGQTEVTNKAVKNYLRSYVNHMQHDWMYWLPRAEFALNNRMNRSIGMSPFFANYGYHPRVGIEPPSPVQPRDARVERADHIVARTQAVDKLLRTLVRAAQDEMAHHANKHRVPHPKYEVGDKVFVNTKSFATSRPSKGLDWHWIGPWPITRVIDHKAYELEIPEDRRAAGLTPVFHPWKLRPAPKNPYPGQSIEPPEGDVFFDDDEEEPHTEYEVAEIVDRRETKRYGVQYKCTYVNNWDEWNADPQWQPWNDFLRSRKLVREYHLLHPDQPPPPQGLLDWVDPEDSEDEGDKLQAQGTSPRGGGGSVRPPTRGGRQLRRNPVRRARK